MSHRQLSCSLRMFFVCSTVSKIPLPLVPMSCPDQSSELVSSLTLSARITRGQREIPSASVLRPPGMCFAVWFQPPLISRRLSKLMSKHDRLSLVPPLREIQDTAAVLSPRIRIRSPFASALSSDSSRMTHAVTTMPNNSSRLIVIVQDSRRSAFLFSSAVSSCGNSYLQNTFLSTQKRQLPRDWRRTGNAFLRVVVRLCSRGR